MAILAGSLVGGCKSQATGSQRRRQRPGQRALRPRHRLTSDSFHCGPMSFSGGKQRASAVRPVGRFQPHAQLQCSGKASLEKQRHWVKRGDANMHRRSLRYGISRNTAILSACALSVVGASPSRFALPLRCGTVRHMTERNTKDKAKGRDKRATVLLRLTNRRPLAPSSVACTLILIDPLRRCFCFGGL